MAGNVCTCGIDYPDPESWRDHMPCPGTPLEQARADADGLRRRIAALTPAILYTGAGDRTLAVPVGELDAALRGEGGE